jgi:hypothetical protein
VSIKFAPALPKEKAIIHQTTQRTGYCALWLSLSKVNTRTCGFIRVLKEHGVWVLHPEEQVTEQRVYGITQTHIQTELQTLSDTLITQNYHWTTGGLLGYLQEVDCLLRGRGYHVVMELVSIED